MFKRKTAIRQLQIVLAAMAPVLTGFSQSNIDHPIDSTKNKDEIKEVLYELPYLPGKKGGPSYKFIDDGNYVIIKHDDSTCAAYWHLMYNSPTVKSGDTVVTGQPIGKVGSTGFSSGPHLHFEVYYYDKKGNYHTLKTDFNTTRGKKQLKTFHFYRKPETKVQ